MKTKVVIILLVIVVMSGGFYWGYKNATSSRNTSNISIPSVSSNLTDPTVTVDNPILQELQKNKQIAKSGYMEGHYHLIQYPPESLTEDQIQERIQKEIARVKEQTKNFPPSAKFQVDATIAGIPESVRKRLAGREEEFDFKIYFDDSSYWMGEKFTHTTSGEVWDEILTSDGEKRVVYQPNQESQLWNNGKLEPIHLSAADIWPENNPKTRMSKNLMMYMDPRTLVRLDNNLYDLIFQSKRFKESTSANESFDGNPAVSVTLIPTTPMTTSFSPEIKVYVDSSHHERVLGEQSFTIFDGKRFSGQKQSYSQFTVDKISGIEYPKHAEMVQYNTNTVFYSSATSILVSAVMDISSCSLNIPVEKSLFQKTVFPKGTSVIDNRFNPPFTYHEEDPPLSQDEIKKRFEKREEDIKKYQQGK